MPNAIRSSGRSVRLGKSTVGPDPFAHPLMLPAADLPAASALDSPFQSESAAPGGPRFLRIERRPALAPAPEALKADHRSWSERRGREAGRWRQAERGIRSDPPGVVLADNLAASVMRRQTEQRVDSPPK